MDSTNSDFLRLSSRPICFFPVFRSFSPICFSTEVDAATSDVPCGCGVVYRPRWRVPRVLCSPPRDWGRALRATCARPRYGSRVCTSGIHHVCRRLPQAARHQRAPPCALDPLRRSSKLYYDRWILLSTLFRARFSSSSPDSELAWHVCRVALGRFSDRVCLRPVAASIVRYPIDHPPRIAVRIRPQRTAFAGTRIGGGANPGYGAAPQPGRAHYPFRAWLAVSDGRRAGFFVPEEPATMARYTGPAVLSRALQRPAIVARDRRSDPRS